MIIHLLLRVLCFAALLTPSTLRAQTIVYVNAAAPTEGDGTSWTTPHKYLAPALANAAAKADAAQTVQVWIAAGTYLPDQSPADPSGGLNDNASFVLHNSVGLYGGFSGGETSLSQRDPGVNRVVLTGFRRDGYFGTLNLITATGVDSSAFVDGFTITNPRFSGGGGKCVRLIQSSVVFRNCAVIDTTTTHGDGAAVNCNGGRPVFEDCEFRGNVNDDPPYKAGAIAAPDTGIQLRRCLFVDNESEGSGGAVYGGGPGAIIEDCLFTSNASVDIHGGAIHTLPGTLVRRCIFDNNFAYGSFGALYGAGLVEDCVFVGNRANTRGGAAGGNATFVNCTFSGNSAHDGGAVSGECTYIGCTFVSNDAWSGGALDGNGTSINCRFVGSVTVCNRGGMFLNCLFSGNSPLSGGQATLRASQYDLTVINCTFSANNGPEIGAVGAGRTVTVRNSIFYKTAGALPEESAHIITSSGAVVTLHNSFLHGLGATYRGNGNIGGSILMSPRFADADGPDNIIGTEDDDLRLLAGSPCIDAGDSGALPPDVLADLAGSPRFWDDPGMPDAGSLTPPVVDMGAYEFQGTSCLADVNGDTFVDGADSEQFNNLFAVADPATDLNRDGFVDGIDADLFNNAFEAGC